MLILVTGATGYIGGRLITRLLDEGYDVRVLVRDPERIRLRPWAQLVDVRTGDLLDPGSLDGLGSGVDAAYYLVHSMDAGDEFEQRDLRAARNFASMANEIPHTVYLGGLLPDEGSASAHLRSRADVGELLRASLPTTEFRAGPIIGSGSASFEMVRYLTERLPAMVAPRWIRNDVQPIAIRDVLAYLMAAIEGDPAGVVEIGADPLTFQQMMEGYADVRGLRRSIFALPLLAPRIAALWVGLVTPIPNRLAVPLIRGIVRPVTADTTRARHLWPEIEPIQYRRAVELALGRIDDRQVETRWSSGLGGRDPAYSLTDVEGSFREVRSTHVPVDPERVFGIVSSLGGDNGWLAWDWAWKIRGALDRVVGGPGLRRGRRDPLELLPGEAVDFWRVEACEPPNLLRLRAEMKVPGAATLEWRISPSGSGTALVQTARFTPKGLVGTLYWYVLYPVHRQIFSALVREVKRRATAEGARDGAPAAPAAQPLSTATSPARPGD